MSLSQLNRSLPPLHEQELAASPPPYVPTPLPFECPQWLTDSPALSFSQPTSQEPKTHITPSLGAPSPFVPLWTHSHCLLLSCELREDPGPLSLPDVPHASKDFTPGGSLTNVDAQ